MLRQQIYSKSYDCVHGWAGVGVYMSYNIILNYDPNII